MQKKIFYIENTNRPQTELQVQIADSFFTRLRGLMLRSKKSFTLGQALLIAPCNSIHMMFMRFPIDVVYIDSDYRVLKTVKNLAPWYGVSWCLQRKCWAVVELPVGSVEFYKIVVGSRLAEVKYGTIE